MSQVPVAAWVFRTQWILDEVGFELLHVTTHLYNMRRVELCVYIETKMDLGSYRLPHGTHKIDGHPRRLIRLER